MNLVRYQCKASDLGRGNSSPHGAHTALQQLNAMTNLVVQAVRKMDLPSCCCYAS